MLAADLETPALVIDLDIMERNLRRAAEYTATHGLRFRPHTKTHKIPALGRRQLDLGATGLTVAKVGEAEVMMAAEPSDLLLEYPTVGRRKLERLADIARQARVTVALDSSEAAHELSEVAVAHSVRFAVLAEVDVGLGRVGVTPGEELLRFVERIRLNHLDFDGIAFFPGHIRQLDTEGKEALRVLACLLEAILRDLRKAGHEVRVVSGGNTSTLFHSHGLPGMNEIRSGTYIFNDRNTVFSGGCGMEDCAASVLTTVVSTARPGQIIVDGGSKTFSAEPFLGGASFGHLVEAPEAVFHKMSKEHGWVDISKVGHNFRIGERVHIIPNHICPTVNEHDVAYGIWESGWSRSGAWRAGANCTNAGAAAHRYCETRPVRGRPAASEDCSRLRGFPGPHEWVPRPQYSPVPALHCARP
jgi:D-serine deaminase-like pyridoxal phosphate-dependent protein